MFGSHDSLEAEIEDAKVGTLELVAEICYVACMGTTVAMLGCCQQTKSRLYSCHASLDWAV
jgi:hypothetical protein